MLTPDDLTLQDVYGAYVHEDCKHLTSERDSCVRLNRGNAKVVCQQMQELLNIPLTVVTIE